MKLLTTHNNKVMKGNDKGYQSYVLHLAPSTMSGINICPKASPGCIASCINFSGHGGMFKPGETETTNRVQECRKRRTKFFHEQRDLFMGYLLIEIREAIRSCKEKGIIPVFRLNCTSDISWEKYPVWKEGKLYDNIFMAFPDIQFYDYTAVLGRKVSNIPNYHLTFSRKENNEEDVNRALGMGMNVAVVFRAGRTKPIPKEYRGISVFDGDKDDLRFLDPEGIIVGLRDKGRAKKDKSGFVIEF
jgi:hypothetical protein